jgi:hypothetical protein
MRLEVLSRVVRCREAIEDGDTGFAYDVLTDLEHDLAGDFANALAKFPCPDCGLHFRWPGQLADHRDNVHWQAAA